MPRMELPERQVPRRGAEHAVSVYEERPPPHACMAQTLVGSAAGTGRAALAGVEQASFGFRSPSTTPLIIPSNTPSITVEQA